MRCKTWIIRSYSLLTTNYSCWLPFIFIIKCVLSFCSTRNTDYHLQFFFFSSLLFSRADSSIYTSPYVSYTKWNGIYSHYNYMRKYCFCHSFHLNILSNLRWIIVGAQRRKNVYVLSVDLCYPLCCGPRLFPNPWNLIGIVQMKVHAFSALFSTVFLVQKFWVMRKRDIFLSSNFRLTAFCFFPRSYHCDQDNFNAWLREKKKNYRFFLFSSKATPNLYKFGKSRTNTKNLCVHGKQNTQSIFHGSIYGFQALCTPLVLLHAYQ